MSIPTIEKNVCHTSLHSIKTSTKPKIQFKYNVPGADLGNFRPSAFFLEAKKKFRAADFFLYASYTLSYNTEHVSNFCLFLFLVKLGFLQGFLVD